MPDLIERAYKSFAEVVIDEPVKPVNMRLLDALVIGTEGRRLANSLSPIPESAIIPVLHEMCKAVHQVYMPYYDFEGAVKTDAGSLSGFAAAVDEGLRPVYQEFIPRLLALGDLALSGEQTMGDLLAPLALQHFIDLVSGMVDMTKFPVDPAAFTDDFVRATINEHIDRQYQGTGSDYGAELWESLGNHLHGVGLSDAKLDARTRRQLTVIAQATRIAWLAREPDEHNRRLANGKKPSGRFKPETFLPTQEMLENALVRLAAPQESREPYTAEEALVLTTFLIFQDLREHEKARIQS